MRKKKDMECFGPLLFGFYLGPLCFSQHLEFMKHLFSFPPTILQGLRRGVLVDE